jgi:uncharacterized C2H2 Zn-finger protein
MTDHDYRCGKCDKPFRTLDEGLQHAQKVHGATRQDVQNERKLHARKR